MMVYPVETHQEPIPMRTPNSTPRPNTRRHSEKFTLAANHVGHREWVHQTLQKGQSCRCSLR
jgi:hypothetical protein